MLIKHISCRNCALKSSLKDCNYSTGSFNHNPGWLLTKNALMATNSTCAMKKQNKRNWNTKSTPAIVHLGKHTRNCSINHRPPSELQAKLMMCHFSSLFISKYEGSFSEEYLHQTQNSSQHSGNSRLMLTFNVNVKKNTGDEHKMFLSSAW